MIWVKQSGERGELGRAAALQDDPSSRNVRGQAACTSLLQRRVLHKDKDLDSGIEGDNQLPSATYILVLSRVEKDCLLEDRTETASAGY